MADSITLRVARILARRIDNAYVCGEEYTWHDALDDNMAEGFRLNDNGSVRYVHLKRRQLEDAWRQADTIEL